MDLQEHNLVVDATMENLSRIVAFVEEQLQAQGCPPKIQGQICVSVEELYVNIVNYAYHHSSGPCAISLCVSDLGQTKKMVLAIKDQGIPFNPLDKEEPDISLSAQDRPIGGLGIYMVKQCMDQIVYEYQDGWNLLTMEKSWT